MLLKRLALGVAVVKLQLKDMSGRQQAGDCYNVALLAVVDTLCYQCWMQRTDCCSVRTFPLHLINSDPQTIKA